MFFYSISLVCKYAKMPDTYVYFIDDYLSMSKIEQKKLLLFYYF